MTSSPFPGPVLPREFFGRPAVEVAPGLLGCVLAHQTADGLVAVRLTEVEAYEGTVDPASHAYRGQTARNAVMFGPAGHAYVYFTYGMHFCMNLVCLPSGTASAVLMRAGEVVTGEDLARCRRYPADGTGQSGPERETSRGGPGRGTGKSAVRDLARGPARLCQALGIDRSLDGDDVCVPESPLRILPPGAVSDESRILMGPRVGVRDAADVPWRFWLEGESTVSPYRHHLPRAKRSGPAK